MSRSNRFDPFAHVHAGNEDSALDTVEPLRVAYAIRENVIDSLEPIEDDDGLRELQDQLVIINGHTQRTDDLEELITKVEHNNSLSTSDFVEIETRFPGTLTDQALVGLEGYDLYHGTLPLAPALESMKAVKGGLALIGVLAVLRFMLRWVGQTIATATPPDPEVLSNEPDLLNAVLEASSISIPDIFKPYTGSGDNSDDDDAPVNVPDDDKEDEPKAGEPTRDAATVAKEKIAQVSGKVTKKAKDASSQMAVTEAGKISAAVRQMTNTGITKKEVEALFRSKKIGYEILMQYQPKAFQFVLKAPVLASSDGLSIIHNDATFLADPASQAALKAFVTSLAGIGTDLRGWKNNIHDGGGVSRQGNPVTPQQPLPAIDNTFAVRAQEKLKWPLTQPQTNGNKVVLQRIDSSAVQELANLYMPVKGGDENMKLGNMSHLDNPEKYAKLLLEQAVQLPKWRAILKSKEKEFTQLVTEVTTYNQEFKANEKLTAEQKEVMQLMTDHVNAAVSNFKSILVWLSTLEKWNGILSKRLNSMVLGMQQLRRVMSGDKTISAKPKALPKAANDDKEDKDDDNE